MNLVKLKKRRVDIDLVSFIVIALKLFYGFNENSEIKFFFFFFFFFFVVFFFFFFFFCCCCFIIDLIYLIYLSSLLQTKKRT